MHTGILGRRDSSLIRDRKTTLGGRARCNGLGANPSFLRRVDSRRGSHVSSQATRFRFTVGQRSHHIVVERPAVVAPAPDEAMFGEPKALSIPGERRTPAKSFKDEAVSMAETLGMRHACESRSRSPLSGRSKNAPPRIRKDR